MTGEEFLPPLRLPRFVTDSVLTGGILAAPPRWITRRSDHGNRNESETAPRPTGCKSQAAPPSMRYIFLALFISL